VRTKLNSLVLLGCGVLTALVAALGGCQSGNTGSPGNTASIPPQSSYRVVGDVGTPFRAVVSDSRSSWQINGTIPTSIVIVNDSPPDRILVTKLTNDTRLLSIQVIQGFSIAGLDSTVSPFGSAVGSVGGTLAAFAIPATPDVRFIVKTPIAGVFEGLIEDESMSNAVESRVPAVIVFDSPSSGTVDGIFNQSFFYGTIAVDLVINGTVVSSASGGNSVSVHGSVS
jgi:hypothetical protein